MKGKNNGALVPAWEGELNLGLISARKCGIIEGDKSLGLL